jgi:NifU-like protein
MASPGEDNLVCRCYVVSEGTIRRAIDEHQLHQVEEVTACTRAGGGCSSCWDDIQAILSEIHGRPLPRNVPDASGFSSAQKRALIVKTIEQNVQSLMDQNRIQMQLVDVTGDRVLVRFFGDAVGTPLPSFLALKRYLVQKMSEACGLKMNLIELNVLETVSKTATR